MEQREHWGSSLILYHHVAQRLDTRENMPGFCILQEEEGKSYTNNKCFHYGGLGTVSENKYIVEFSIKGGGGW